MRPVGAVRLALWPMSIQGANEYVARWHRHHKPVRSALCALACGVAGEIEPRGVAIIGRPVARGLQDGRTAEVVRVSTDGMPNAPSFLLRRAANAARALGYSRLVTYTLASEPGARLRALGLADPVPVRSGRTWSTPARRTTDKSTAQGEAKLRWTLFDTVEGNA